MKMPSVITPVTSPTKAAVPSGPSPTVGEDRVDEREPDHHEREPQDRRDRGNDDATVSITDHAARC